MKWSKARVDDLADLCLGKMLDQNKNRGELLPYLANINVRWGEFVLTDLRQMRFQSNEMDRYGLKSGDIVMCEGGEPGRCAIWKEQMPGMMIQKALHRIRARDGIDHRFLYYSFLHNGRNGRFGHLLTGATIKHLPRQNLAKLEVEFPKFPTQGRIADVLSAYDDLIENNRRRMDLLEKAARLLYQEWFVRLRFPGHEHTRAANGTPHGWRKEPLNAICPDLREAANPADLDAGTPYIGLEHMPRRSITLNEWGRSDEVTSTKLRFKSGDILFGKIRPYFHKVGFALTDGVASSDAIVLRPAAECFQSFALLTVSSDWFVTVVSKTAKEGSKMPRADWNLMEQHQILVPPHSILLALQETVAPILEQLRILSFSNQKLRAARDLLLPRLMTGEVTVQSMRNDQAFHAPLHPLDTDKQTFGCRHTSPDICAKNSIPKLCALVRAAKLATHRQSPGPSSFKNSNRPKPSSCRL
ncbi:MAG: restriction endonuclease subunit S [Limisphaerales bacterium]